MAGSVSLTSLATWATIGSAALGIANATGILGGGKGGGQMMPAPSAANDDIASQDSARASAINKRRAIAAGGSKSLLATIGGGAGDGSPSAIGTATANPGVKTTLGG